MESPSGRYDKERAMQIEIHGLKTPRKINSKLVFDLDVITPNFLYDTTGIKTRNWSRTRNKTTLVLCSADIFRKTEPNEEESAERKPKMIPVQERVLGFLTKVFEAVDEEEE